LGFLEPSACADPEQRCPPSMISAEESHQMVAANSH
jgi:hypothetical protein